MQHRLQYVINKIESYKERHGEYPGSLKQLHVLRSNLHYRTDPGKEKFYLSYSNKRILANTQVYSSETKSWRKSCMLQASSRKL
jgi:hypothetical protein